MTIQECYCRLGGDYAQVERRLPGVSLIARFLAKFPEDGSYTELCGAMREGQRAEAFRAAHTLKGVCANLGLDRLFGSSSALAELLRGEGDSIPEGAEALLCEVKQDYELTVSTIRAYLEAPAENN